MATRRAEAPPPIYRIYVNDDDDDDEALQWSNGNNIS